MVEVEAKVVVGGTNKSLDGKELVEGQLALEGIVDVATAGQGWDHRAEPFVAGIGEVAFDVGEVSNTGYS